MERAPRPVEPAPHTTERSRPSCASHAGRPALAVLQGEASWYSDALAGHATASGERYDPAALTAAHPSLPFGTVLRVRVADGEEGVCVRVNDRGPKGKSGRILDLSRAAAERLGLVRAGVVSVRAEVLEYGARRAGHKARRRAPNTGRPSPSNR